MMTRVALYSRYSSDRQNERSIADQVALCSRYAADRGWEISRVFSDAAISGSAMANRPGLLDAIAAGERAEFDILLAEDEDRLARDLEQQAHVFNRIIDAGAQLWTVATGQVQLMHVAMKGFMAESFIQNLSAKTKRGMRSNAEKGLATGSRLYGYRGTEGGAIVIHEGEADTVRRIFADYAAGDTAREIALALNTEAVPGPRGGLWNQSTIVGSRQRANGILNTELYVGVKVWGRMDVRKDRRTGKRLPRMLPESDWKRTPVPHLRIVDDATWAAVRARKDRATPSTVQRRPGIFSGLLKCGACGGTYTVYTTGKLICATYREKGTCTNRRTPNRAAVEARVLEGLRERILTPEAVATYVRTYHRARQARRAAETARRDPVERRLGEIDRGVERIIDAIVDGSATKPMKDRMMEMEAERERLQAELALIAEEPPPAFELHPGAADAYAGMVEELQVVLREVTTGETRAQRQLVENVRGLIDRIVITPLTQDRGGPIDIVLHGTLARFMGEPEGNVGLGALVAGARYSRTQPSVPLSARLRL